MNNKNLGEVTKETRTLRTHLNGYINDCLTALNGNYITKQEYEYDELYQLTKVTGYTESNKYKLQTPDLLSEYTQEFKFDSIGNMTQKKSTEWVKYNRKVGDDLNYNTLEYTIMPGYAHRVQNIGGRYFEYDAAGNIIVEQDGKIYLEDSSKYYKIEQIDENKYIADSAWGYYTEEDRENNKTKVYRRTYEWDDKNQLIKSQDDNVTVCYTYGSDGQRASKYTENSETLYTNNFWVFHVSGSVRNGAGIINKNIYLGKMRVVTKVKEAYDAMEITERQCQYFYHSDHLGSAQLVTDNKGNEYQRIEYTPYGETWIDLKATQNDLVKLNYKFTAKELDEETGLYYYGARYLNPKYSMWISTDPAMNTGEYFPVAPINDEAKRHNSNLPGMGGVFNHINLHCYHYAGNNPVKYTDPDGRFDWEIQLFEFWAEETLNGNPPTQKQILNDIINCSNQQFSYTFEKIQQDLTKGIVAGMRFISEYGDEISFICYATGNVQLAIIVDGISFICDASLAIYDYQNSDKTKKDKIKLTVDISTTITSTLASGKVGEYAAKRFYKFGQNDFNDKISNMLSTIIGAKFDDIVDSFVEVD